MCGIVGYIGSGDATPFLIDGLTRLEYRGYDSSGIAVYNGERIVLQKTVGKLEELKKKIQDNMPSGKIGVGHTRWATHGRPSDRNSHPHISNDGNFIVVHNGIIENYLTLKEDLIQKGFSFLSETDTEVVAQLMQAHYDGDFLSTVKKVRSLIEGSYSLTFICAHNPDTLICMKKDNPLIIGLGEGENYIASDIPAIIAKTRRTYILSDGELAVITKDSVKIENLAGEVVDKQVFNVSWNAQAAEKGGYEHFMIKEIYEQPKAIRDTFSGRISKDLKNIHFDELAWTKEDLSKIKKIYMVACGTAYHAGLVGKHYIEQLCGISVETDIASEFRYRKPLVDKDCLMIVVSQSGETIDTLAALKEAKRLGAKTLAITNVVDSSIAREADNVIYTYAGPEIAVASTKAYTTQVMILLILAIYMGEINGKLLPSSMEKLIGEIKTLPDKMHQMLEDVSAVKIFAEKYAANEDVFFLGRLIDYAVALEGSLKLKEISYIHAEAYAAGELKHGTLALIVERTPVIVLATQKDVYEKTLSNIKEVKARDAIVIGIAMQNDTMIDKYVDHVVRIPVADGFLAPILAVVPLQLIAYYAALTRGCNVDMPRNLAKSVTVE